jgi:hypothetical protein
MTFRIVQNNTGQLAQFRRRFSDGKDTRRLSAGIDKYKALCRHDV